EVSIEPVPGVAEIAVGKVDPSVLSDFSDEPRVTKARIVDSALLAVDAMAHGEVKNLGKTRLTYSPTEIAARTTKTVSTRDTLTSAVKTLIGDMDVDVDIKLLNLALNTSLVTKALASTLTAVTPAIDELLYNLLLVAGVRIGEADVTVTGVCCQCPALLQWAYWACGICGTPSSFSY